MHSDFRWKQRFEHYQSALRELQSALEQKEYTKLERAGVIQLFEVSFELAWKTLKDMLFYEGFDVNSPRGAIKQAFANGLLTEGELWLKALEGRNLFLHTYDSNLAAEAVRLIREEYAPLLFALERALENRQ